MVMVGPTGPGEYITLRVGVTGKGGPGGPWNYNSRVQCIEGPGGQGIMVSRSLSGTSTGDTG